MFVKSFYRYTLIRFSRFIRWVFFYNLLVARKLFTLKRLRVFSFPYWQIERVADIRIDRVTEQPKKEQTNNVSHYWEELNV